MGSPPTYPLHTHQTIPEGLLHEVRIHRGLVTTGRYRRGRRGQAATKQEHRDSTGSIVVSWTHCSIYHWHVIVMQSLLPLEELGVRLDVAALCLCSCVG